MHLRLPGRRWEEARPEARESYVPGCHSWEAGVRGRGRSSLARPEPKLAELLTSC